MPTKTAPTKPSKETTEKSAFIEVFDAGEIKLSDRNSVKVRLVQSDKGINLDIRQFLTSVSYTGFTSKGVSIPPASVSMIKEMIDKCANHLANNVAKKPKGKK